MPPHLLKFFLSNWNSTRYPFDAYVDPIYPFAYIFISSTGTICCFGLAGMDGIFVSICLHISAQFRILKHDFEQLAPAFRNGLLEIFYSREFNFLKILIYEKSWKWKSDSIFKIRKRRTLQEIEGFDSSASRNDSYEWAYGECVFDKHIFAFRIICSGTVLRIGQFVIGKSNGL